MYMPTISYLSPNVRFEPPPEPASTPTEAFNLPAFYKKLDVLVESEKSEGYVYRFFHPINRRKAAIEQLKKDYNESEGLNTTEKKLEFCNRIAELNEGFSFYNSEFNGLLGEAYYPLKYQAVSKRK